MRGSHIVVPMITTYKGTDGRIIFSIPYEQDFTLIGTTDMDHQGAPGAARCSDAERDYLCAFASQYFARSVTPEQVVWTYSGVRPLYNDGAKSATAATRDYVLSLDRDGRRCERVWRQDHHLSPAGGKRAGKAFAVLSACGRGLDRGRGLARGDFPVDGAPELVAELRAGFAFLDARQALRLVQTLWHRRAALMLDGARSMADLGRDFGAGLTETEVNWLIENEFARTAQDILWRRTKLGLHMNETQIREWRTSSDQDRAAAPDNSAERRRQE